MLKKFILKLKLKFNYNKNLNYNNFKEIMSKEDFDYIIENY